MLYLQDFPLVFSSLPNLLCPTSVWQNIFGVIGLLVCWGLVGYVTAGKDGDLCIQFGLMGVDEFGQYYVQQETTHVPLYPVEYYPEFRFGYTLEFADERMFSSYFMLTLPKPPKVIQGGLVEAERIENGRILKSIPLLFQGGAAEALAFNKSDPVGRWKVDIYVNDECVRKIGFRVVLP